MQYGSLFENKNSHFGPRYGTYKSNKGVEINTKTLSYVLNRALRHDDRRIRIQSRSRIRIDTSDYWFPIRIQEAQKHVDPVDPDPDPQHWS